MEQRLKTRDILRMMKLRPRFRMAVERELRRTRPAAERETPKAENEREPRR
jgi:hypothetical protein